MATLGSVVIAFSASTGAYLSGSKQVKDDAKSVGETFSGMSEAIGGAFEGIGIALSVEGVVDSLKEHFSEAAKAVTDLARDADKLSTSTKTLSELRFAAKDAGVDAEGLSKAMLKAQENIGKAATEGGAAAKTLGQFGFSVKELVNQNPADQFKSIADTISHISNVSQRSAAEVAIFGKQGAELKPLLEEGAEGLNKAAAEADKLGVAMSDVDAQNMLRASQAVGKVQDAMEGIENTIVSRLAPFIESATNSILKWAESGDVAGKIVNGAMEAVSYGAAAVVDLYELLKGAAEISGSIQATALEGVIVAWDAVAKAGAWVLNHVFGTEINTSYIDKAADYLEKKATELGQAGARDLADGFTGSSAAKVMEWFDDVQAKANATSQAALDAKGKMADAFSPPAGATEGMKKIAEIIADLHKQVDEFGQSEGNKKIMELRKLGAGQDQIADAQAQADQLGRWKQQIEIKRQLADLDKQARQAGMDEAAKKVDDLQSMGASAGQIAWAKESQSVIEELNKAKAEGKRLDEEAKRAKESALTPLQKEAEAVKLLTELEEKGRLTHAEYAAAKAKAERELHGQEHHTQAAATRGSQEAFRLINEINNRNNGKNAQEQLAAKQVKATDDGNHLLKDIATSLKPKPPKQLKIAI
jgi:hypothetical protein